MEIGIFARTFPGTCVEDVLDAVAASGIRCVHFNFACAGIGALPDAIGDELCARIVRAFDQRRLGAIGVSATFNAIHPEVAQRLHDTDLAYRIIEAAPLLNADVVTLCTGSRDPVNMWRAHPGNDTQDAWRDLIATLTRLLLAAERAGVTLGIEPECGNVINSAHKARRLLDEIRSPRLGIIMDGANLFDAGDTTTMRETLTEAFDLLGDDIVHVHAKDIASDTTAASAAAGTGLLDWELYFDLIARIGFTGPIVLHNLQPHQVAASQAFVRQHIARTLNA